MTIPALKNRPRSLRFAAVVLLVLVAGVALAQFRGRRDYESVQTAREADANSVPTPNWENDQRFKKDVFTFVRLKYSGGGRYGGYGGYRGSYRWATDFPDSDLNLSYRVQQMTSLKVDPNGRVLDITDPALFEFPWVYMAEPGDLMFTDEEVPVLRKYLLNGGFLMADDFWGEAEWDNFEREIKRVFPDRNFVELPLEHPLYHCVFDIKSKGQCPNYRTGERSQYDGVTWEREDAREVHHRAIFDDKGRIMVIATHNTDNGDGWEREGEYIYYFRNFSEKIAYPLGINIIFYAMTH